MIRVGLVDFDTSHVVEFTKRLNHVGIDRDQWVDGAQVVAGCPGSSEIEASRIPGYTAELKKFGVKLVDKPEELLGQIDAVMIESQGGKPHRARAEPFLKAGLPCFIDKPFTCSVVDARAIADLAAKHKAPVFSSSSLRYAPELAQFGVKGEQVLGAFAYGPAAEHPGNPGLFHYGIHPVEVLYTLMGPGCSRVTTIYDKGAEVVTGHWQGGRVASVRGIRAGGSGYGAVAFTDKGVSAINIGTKYIYRELLKQVVTMFQTRKAPLDINVTVEIVAFIEAAARSAVNHGSVEEVRKH